MLRENLPYIVLGLTSGSVMGLVAMGVTLTFKTSGIFNFAQSSIAAAAIYAFLATWQNHGWARWSAVLVTVVGLGLVLGVVFERIARRLSGAPAVQQVSAMVGTVLLLDWLAPAVYRFADVRWRRTSFRGGFTRGLGSPTWLSSSYRSIGGVIVPNEGLLITAIAVVAAAALWLLLRFTRLGVAMRAVVDNPDLLALDGTDPAKVRRRAWAIGIGFTALAGILLQSQTAVQPSALSMLLVQATGAAAIGAFGSIPLAYFGGLAIGVGSAITLQYSASWDLMWKAIPVSLPFLVLLAALVLAPTKLLRRGINAEPLPRRRRLPARTGDLVQLAGIVAVLAGLALVPRYVDDLLHWDRSLSYVILFLSLGLLVRTSGQLSLCHLGFAAVGVAGMSEMLRHGFPWPVALVLAGLLTVPVGALVAIPAIRLSGLYLALATLAFGFALQYFFYATRWLFGISGGRFVARPTPGDSDRGYYYVILAVVAAAVALVVVVERSRLGRLLSGLAESPNALRTSGTDVNVTRTLIFCLSAFLAGIGGAVYGASYYYISSGPFPAVGSLAMLALVMIAPGRAPFYAFIAAVGFAIIRGDILLPAVNWYAHPHLEWIGRYNIVEPGPQGLAAPTLALFGLLALLAALRATGGLRSPRLQRLLRRVRPGVDGVAIDRAAASPATRPVDVAAKAPGERAGASGLVVDGITVRYGSVVAVDVVSLEAPTARITGLIGPNGAGKSSLFDACSGLLRPTAGRVRLHGDDVTRLSAAARSRRGLGRTFQRAQLWPSLTVAENVVLGREARLAGVNPIRHLVRFPGDAADADATARWALELCGLLDIADTPASVLTTSERRLLELARCLASGADVLLLDEPSAGLDGAESARLAAVLRDAVATRGVAVLLVEHDMGLVMSLCDHVYVLDVGRLLAEGTPDEIRADPAVQAAYLGTDEPADAVGSAG